MTQLAVSSPLLAPIAGASPTGIDLAYDPDFDRLSAEIEKLSALTGETPDWRTVASEAERVLAEKSKDLRVMGWLLAAQATLGRWAAIESGLGSYLALLRAYWNDLHPARSRGRARAGQIEWMCGFVGRRVAVLDVMPAETEHVKALEPLVAELIAFCTENLGDLAPSTGPLRVAVRDKIRDLPAPPPPPPPPPLPTPAAPAEAPPLPTPSVERAPAPAVPAPPPVVAVSMAPAAAADLEQTLDAARPLREPLRTLAHHARQIAPANPWSYRTLRFAAWLAIDRLPEAEHGKSFVRAPKTSELDELASRHAAAQWDGVRELAEEAVGLHPFWLDAHRYAAAALDAKGAEYREARDTVARAVCGFLERLPGVEQLRFSNDVPFATPETLDWLAAERRKLGGGSGAAVPAEDAVGELTRALDARLGDGPVDRALGEALAEARQLPLARDRFCARLAVAKRARVHDRFDLALALFEQLAPEVDATLERWEPQLAAELLGAYLDALRGRVRNFEGATTEEDAKDHLAAALYRRLLLLDPHAALRSGTPW